MFKALWRRPPRACEDLPITLVVGCARSGTSILGELIAAHPRVKYFFEANKIWDLAGPGEGDSHRLTAGQANDKVRRQIREHFDAHRVAAGPGKLLVEKCPRNALRVPFLRAVLPEAKFIHIVRDGRDVACSLRPGVGGDEWAHLKPVGWADLFRQHQGAVRCAQLWRSVLETTLADLADVPHLMVRYEDLLSDPAAVADRILDHLGLPSDPTVTAFSRKIQDRTADSYQAQRQDWWSRADHAKRVGRWQENLSPAEQLAVGTLLAPLLERLGYPTADDRRAALAESA